MANSMDSGARRGSSFSNATGPGASCLTSLCFGFLIRKMGILVTIIPHTIIEKINFLNIAENRVHSKSYLCDCWLILLNTGVAVVFRDHHSILQLLVPEFLHPPMLLLLHPPAPHCPPLVLFHSAEAEVIIPTTNLPSPPLAQEPQWLPLLLGYSFYSSSG